jgi:hypothetical protein
VVGKIAWSGRVVSVQPRIRLTRSFDERFHSYLGYCLFIDGLVGDERREFSVGLGKATYRKHEFRVGDELSGESVPIVDERKESVEFYRTSKLKLLQRIESEVKNSPPWHGVAPDLEVYRWRGHRRLAVRTYK